MTPSRLRILVLTGLLALSTGPAAAAPPPLPQLVEPASGEKLKWLIKPDTLEMARIANDHAITPGAFALVECVIGKNGRPRDCVVLEETPPASGAAKVTMEFAYLYKAASKDSLGQPTTGRKVTYGFRFGGWKAN